MSKTAFPKNPVLLVDDEETWTRSFSLALKSAGINNILCCNDSREVEAILETTEVEVIAADLAMPHVSGEDLIRLVTSKHADIPILVITGMSQVETAVQCVKLGAFDFFVKTYDKSSLVSGIRHAIQIRELKRENTTLRSRFFDDRLERPEIFENIVTANSAMRSIFKYIEAIAESSQPVLITGESGVGKELIAGAIHRASGRSGEFVPVNVAGLDDNIFADTLFGHKKGAFTGADKARPGLVVNAGGGTLFLDEIGDLAHGSQLKLLRLVQEREYMAIGSDLTRKTDARIIAATNIDPEELNKSGRFRSDLYYRLKAHHVHIPPLRDRKEDLPLLVDYFLSQACESEGRAKPEVPGELSGLLMGYDFPGNVRELQFMVMDAVSCTEGTVLNSERLQNHIGKGAPVCLEAGPTVAGSQKVAFGTELPTLKEVSEELTLEAMRRAENNQVEAARSLGISRQALNKRLNNMKRDNSDS
ncbi:sigma-54 dependent transcriptional regulator [Desulfovibrio sp. JC010]|uniref:sigma-54-dependent transcriptional regulator n=1 Tax=Desulfovibrio sp. JC010 TaxID=2593641 RepID=UPI0013D4B775|nr:sigma-54 dependent transcriptional regulator [Desulfovibrio sp. JC010]NDV26030.1 sigma-54-dependent Fis family transcriptional regulator [Desulfovibrio sp. JC010]